MRLNIEAIEYYLPELVVKNEDIKDEFPNWSIDKLSQKTGVFSRHIASKSETAYDFSLVACKKLREYIDFKDVDGIIYCTQSPNYIMPSNSFLLHRDLGLDEGVFCYDFNHACTGFIYCLQMAQAYMKASMASKILIVTSDTYSKYIKKDDRSTRLLFGDGAAATIVTREETGTGIIDMEICSNGKNWDKFFLKSKASLEYTGSERDQYIFMNGFAVWSFINSRVPTQIEKIVKRNQLELLDIDLIIPHQASMMTIETIIKKLKIKKEKIFINIENRGNTVSASIPIALKDAMLAKKVSRGMTLILSGFGVGLSYGTILLKY